MGPTGAAMEKPKISPLMKNEVSMGARIGDLWQERHGLKTFSGPSDLKKEGKSGDEL